MAFWIKLNYKKEMDQKYHLISTFASVQTTHLIWDPHFHNPSYFSSHYKNSRDGNVKGAVDEESDKFAK